MEELVKKSDVSQVGRCKAAASLGQDAVLCLFDAFNRSSKAFLKLRCAENMNLL